MRKFNYCIKFSAGLPFQLDGPEEEIGIFNLDKFFFYDGLPGNGY